MTTDPHFTTLTRELSRRAARAVVSHLGPASTALRDHLDQHLAADLGSKGGLLTSPVFESLFDWALHDTTVEQVPFLSPRLIDAMDLPRVSGDEFRFPRTRRPRTHQFRSWEVLCNDPVRSVLVRTGTASGKTECFMVPVLNSLARELDRSPAPKPLVGVRALFLYPLNALIQSQRNRLRAWSSGFGGDVRFALYNGLTRETVDQATQALSPEEVVSRKGLRASPPPVLVTNATMLEYMLVRGSDGEILKKSKGQLRWIVLDEAHTYLGSTAAEIALLLRRVMDAFEVDPKDVRFVATSATIGDASSSSTTQALRKFLADLGGIDPASVEIVDGRRVAPPLPSDCLTLDAALPKVSALRHTSADDRYRQLASNRPLRELREKLQSQHATLDEITKTLHGNDNWPLHATETLELLDLATATTTHGESTPFLPLRGHFFGRTMPGLWACCDEACTERVAHGPHGDTWRFGRVYLERRSRCECGALCFEVVFCRACGESYLEAWSTTDNEGLERWSANESNDEDDEDGTETQDEEQDDTQTWDRSRVLLVGQAESDGASNPRPMHRESGILDDEGAKTIALRAIPKRTNNSNSYENPQCVRCHEGHRGDRPLVRSARLGANFFLGVNTPTLLEREEPWKNAVVTSGPPVRPAEGRRLLTFSDSRQGSARFALGAQLAAERNFARAFIYHTLWSRAAKPDPAKVAELELDIAEYEALPLTHRHRPRLQLARAELAELRSGKPMTWPEMITLLAQKTEVAWIRGALTMHYGPAQVLSDKDIARLILIREFARRPRRQNSLETMGLVALDYVGLDKLDTAPVSWLDAGFRQEEWRSFIKIAIDFFVRNLTALVVDKSDFRWIGSHFSTPVILPPDGDGTKNRAYPWPTASGGKRLFRYLDALMDQAEAPKDRRTKLDAVLRDAWNEVTAVGLLQNTGEGYRLNLAEQGRFRLVREAWHCPLTRRLLDTTLRGQSPYLPRTWVGGAPVRLAMPTLAHPFPHVSGIGVAEVLRWLENDPDVLAARAAGVWNEFSDRIAAYAPTIYFRAGEHSAQQSPGILKRLEDGFNDHAINVLSCSTTMEMGVDIGGLNTVAMNNVPPAPANYRQRAGRAGRANAQRATVFTLCNASPHGEEVYRDPRWPFEAAVAAPAVSLNSRRIVERHVNALCLGRYFRAHGIKDGIQLECSGFFTVPSGAVAGAASSFAAFCAWLEVARDDGTFEKPFVALLRHSALEGAAPGMLLGAVIDGIRDVNSRWSEQRAALVGTLVDLGGTDGMDFKKAEPAQRALLVQLARHDGEYLLRYLAAEGFLPSHGFPMHVVPFVTLTAEALAHAKSLEAAKGEQREDGFPSRHLAQAIREYAPGAGVVINGMVYMSAGIALNWKRPVTASEAHEIQDLGYAWRCRRCGAADMSGEKPSRCPHCDGDAIAWNRMLRPTGFSVDFYKKPHNDLSLQQFVPVKEPWISAGGAAWVALGGTSVGRYRSTPEGHVVHRSGAALGFGYAVCLHCGRAAPETSPKAGTPLPRDLVDHTRLRGGKGDEAHCTANDNPSFKIQRHVWLGGAEVTDVLELQLHEPGSGAPLRDEVVCVTLAVALRRAVAARLGVDPREIGWSVIPSRTATGDQTRSIVLFDATEGGAGYVTAAVPALREIIGELPKHLACKRRCDRACHGCLLGYDTQWALETLDRNAAACFVSQTFLDALVLPAALRAFGTGTGLECRPLREALEVVLASAVPTAIRVHLGDDGEWELVDWSLLRRLRLLAEADVKVTLVLTEARIATLDWLEARELLQQAEVGGFTLAAVKNGGVHENSGALIVELAAHEAGAPVTHGWARCGAPSWAPGIAWGEGDGTAPLVVVRRPGGLPDLGLRTINAQKELERAPPGHAIPHEWKAKSLNGAVEFVGKRFWDGLAAASPALTAALKSPKKLKRVFLRDRYIGTPASLRVVVEVFRHLHTMGVADATTEFALETRSNKSGSDWTEKVYGAGQPIHQAIGAAALQQGALNELWKQFGKGSAKVCEEVHHDRRLELQWADGLLTIYLHQGLTFLRVKGTVKILKTEDPIKLANAIRDVAFDLEMPESTTVHIGQVEKS